MTTVGFATLDVIPSMKGLRAELGKSDSEFATSGKRGGEKFGDAAGKAAGGRFKSKFAGLAKDAFAPIAGFVAGAAIVNVFKDAIGGASDLAESANKVQTIFGDATAQVQEFASQGAKALGQTRLSVLDAASSFGTFGKAAGLSGAGLADFSTKLAGLSTDMSSFFNTSPEQAIEAIGAALRGEAEPIRAYGVLLDDATLRQEALRQGLVKTTKEALTPQQKVLAAYQVILQQTADAQGDFGRTSGGLANQQRILSAQWSEMETELGTKLLPVVTKFVSVANDSLIPGLEAAGGVVADTVGAFNSLPTPIKAAAGALIAFRIAQATGITTTFASGVGALGKGLQDVRLRAMLAADEFRTLKSGTLELNGQVGKFTPGVSRLNASLGALRTGSIGAGSALKRGLGGAVGLLGGPWGIALAVGTVALTHFWQEQQKAKERVEDLRASLNQQTGAITDNTRQVVANALEQAGALKTAQDWGISLDDVTNAALGAAGAQARIRDVLKEAIAVNGEDALITDERVSALGRLVQAVGQESSALTGSVAAQKRVADATNDGTGAVKRNAEATKGASDTLKTYASSVSEARSEIKQLAAAEEKRRLSIIQNKRDRIALLETLAATRVEARKGKDTLDVNTKAGRTNMSALLDLADQWNQSSPKVKNARGAYGDLRREFIDLADQMNGPNGTREQARKLAEQLLKVPKSAPVRFKSEGYKELKAQIRELQETKIFIATTFGTGVAGSGGRVAPVEGGNTPTTRTPRTGGTSERGVTVNIGTVQAHDYQDFMTGMGRRTSAASLDGVHR